MTLPRRAKALVAWSSGKDSAYAFYETRRRAELEITGLLTTLTGDYGRVSMHGVREALLDQQAERLGLPCKKMRIPAGCPNERYDAELAKLLEAEKREGVTHVVFGDLFLEDIRAYRERLLGPVGLVGVFPLWQRNTGVLAREMLAAGLSAIVTTLDPRTLPRALAGRRFDAAFLDELPPAVDPCGENGEFHTFVTAGPMFRQPISVRVGEIVERDGFVFADLMGSG